MPDNYGYERQHKHNCEEHPGKNNNRREISKTFQAQFSHKQTNKETNEERQQTQSKLSETIGKGNNKRTREERDKMKEARCVGKEGEWAWGRSDRERERVA